MTARRACLVLLLASATVTVARSGHELPVYPSYYPHEIEMRAVLPERAGALLVDGKLHAYAGATPRRDGAWPGHVQAIESLGSFVLVRLNPSSPHAQEEQSACAAAGTIARTVAATSEGLVAHPYPVTPLHGDYLHHVDLAETVKRRVYGDGSARPTVDGLKVKAGGSAQTVVPAEWRVQDGDWDAEVVEVTLASLIDPERFAINGWQGPPGIRSGWFHAHRLLAASIENPPARERVATNLQRLEAGPFVSPLERINLERDFVASLAFGCHASVIGYRVKREFINVEFSAGIENIAFDALDGLNAPMFLRTVKLKDFPWNGWLSLGIDGRPAAAWNPIAGFNDRFGRLLWAAVGDPAAVPSPYDSGWVLNRISDVQPAQ
jgi:hypothetical protein